MSQFNAPTYDIDKPTGRCALTGRALEPGRPYIATLVEEGDDLRRLDVAADAWDAGRRPEHLFSYWKAIVPEPNQKRKLLVDDGVLMNLLERLGDATQPQRLAFRFVLMLILMRKKLVRYDGTDRTPVEPGEAADLPGVVEGERHFWRITPKLDLSKGPLGKWDDSRAMHVLDPHLDEAGIRAVTDQLSEILQAEL